MFLLYEESAHVRLLEDRSARSPVAEVHVAAEHKLSGELDSKSIEANAERLKGFRDNHHDGRGAELLTAVVMPVADPTGKALNRWANDATKYGVDALCFNEGIYPVLFSLPEPPPSEYRQFVSTLSSYAADGVVAYLSEGTLEYDAAQGWRRPATQGCIF